MIQAEQLHERDFAMHTQQKYPIHESYYLIMELGPLIVKTKPSRTDISLHNEPSTSKWPVIYEMCVGSALARVMYDLPKVRVHLQGWQATQEKCPSVYELMQHYEAVWDRDGCYSVSPYSRSACGDEGELN